MGQNCWPYKQEAPKHLSGWMLLWEGKGWDSKVRKRDSPTTVLRTSATCLDWAPRLTNCDWIIIT